MTLYRGQADQTVINAAKTAYTYPTVDYTSFFTGLANVAKFITGKVDAANSRMSTITGFEEEVDKQFWSNNNSEFFGGLKQNMVDASNIMKFNPKWSQKYKDAERIFLGGQEVLNKLKKDEAILEQWIKDVDRGLVDLSAYNDPALISLMADIKLGRTFDESVMFTEDGIQVIGPSGDYILVDELPAIVKKSDGQTTKDFITDQITASITHKTNGTWDERNRHLVLENIKTHLDDVGISNMGSAAFDFEYMTEDGPMSFADYLLKTHPDMKQQFEQWLLDNPGEHDEKNLVAAKHMIALNLWDDDYLMRDEFVEFIEGSLDYQVEGTSTSSHNKNNKNRKNKKNNGSGDDLPDPLENVTNLDGTLYEGDLPGVSAGDVVFSGTEHADLGDNAMYKMVHNDDETGTLMFFDRKNNKWKPSEKSADILLKVKGELFPNVSTTFTDDSVDDGGPIMSGGTITSSTLTSLVETWGKEDGASNLKTYLENNNLIPEGYEIKVRGRYIDVYKDKKWIMNEKDQSIRGGADRTDIINILEALGHKVDKTVTKTKTETKTETKTKTKTSKDFRERDYSSIKTFDGNKFNLDNLHYDSKNKAYYYSPDGTKPKTANDTSTRGHRYLNMFKDSKLLKILK